MSIRRPPAFAVLKLFSLPLGAACDNCAFSLIIGVVLVLCPSAQAQETVFNVPSADVLEKSKVYTELDVPYNSSEGSVAFTPRLVVGVAGRVEVGINLNGLGIPGDLQTTLTPTLKWKAYDRHGWSILLGDSVYVPVQNRTYDAGNYFYLESAKSWKTGTRATFGVYHFTSSVVAPGQRAGGQFAIEQPLRKNFTVAADWYTGDNALGYVTPGVIFNFTPKLVWYGAYQIGNRGVSSGNHQLLFELGWNIR